MSLEILLLGIACGMTLLAYMIAINAHGPTRLSLSYLLATIMLAGNVWGVIQYVNAGRDAQSMKEFKRLEAENRLAEEKLQEQEKTLRAHKEKIGMVALFNNVITTGSSLASFMVNVNLQDKAMEIDALIARANEYKGKVEKLNTEYQNMQFNNNFLPEARAEVTSAIQLLGEACQSFRNYYYAEDTQQEMFRERQLRQKSKQALEKFKAASSSISALKD